MPNQMIALQARGGRVADPARITAQYANMMTAARQAEAAQTQGALARQTMANNQASEARAATAAITAEQKAKFEYTKGLMAEYTNRLAKIDATDKTRYSNLRQQIIQDIPTLESELPTPDEWNEKSKFLVISDAEKFLRYKYATPVASTAINDRTGQTTSITAGGVDPRAEVIGEVPFQSATPTTPVAAAPMTAGTNADMRATQGSNTTPQDLFSQGMNPNNIPTGTPTVRPISFNQSDMGGAGAAQMTPELMSRIADSAFQTGVIAQVDFDQLLATQPPENRQAFTDAFQQANITLQADAPSLADSGMGQQQMAANPVQRPQAGFAVMRGPTPQSRTASLGDAPEVQTTMAQSQGRTPFISRREAPYPASAQVAPGVLAAQEAAKAQATENVRLQMAPKIAGATKTAERAVERKPEALVAKNETKAASQPPDKYIEEIDALLRSADRRFIVGRFEGRIPYVLQDERQSELQAMYDRVKNANTLGALVEGKQASPSGGSPVGPASNLDVQLVAKSASSLTQTGGVAKFDEDLKKLRREAYRTRQRRIEFYSDRYGDLVSEDPKFKLNVPPIADRYISTKDLPQNKSSAGARKTSVIPEGAKQMLRKNPSPQQRAFFDRTFGAGAAAKVLGAR